MSRTLLFHFFLFVVLTAITDITLAQEKLLKNTLLEPKQLCSSYAGTGTLLGSKPEKLIIGYRADAAPFSYRDSQGHAAGYVVDICNDIAEAIVGKGNYSAIEVTSSSRFKDLDSAKIDLLCDSSTLTRQREACFDYSLLTFPSGPSLAHKVPLRLFTKDTPPRVGILGGPSSTLQQAQRGLVVEKIRDALGQSAFQVVTKQSYEELFAALGTEVAQEERIDAVFADREILLARFHIKSFPAFKVLDAYLGYEPYTIYMRPDRDFRFVVNVAMTKLYSSERIHRILKENFHHLSDTVGQMIILQRIPEGKIYK